MDGLGEHTTFKLMIFHVQLLTGICLLLSNAAHTDKLWQAEQQVFATSNPFNTRQRHPLPSQRPVKVNYAKWCFYYEKWGLTATRLMIIR
ncbi:hypothetical protein T11_13559 [Trichinella zimbabwensis]|uniref:Uncharacterized protein n=1 Tax=Trichinella zimbabwensis TaxID=268475 RepID=A0A0V1GVH2_9BILA|nr:hypothetical protein T11_13559 [Trichinella zimbabwensis]